MFDRFTSRILVNGTLIAETGLHVGVGASSLDPTATDARVIRDSKGRPFIPGSSFKGALRSHLESIVRALGRSDLWACDPLADPCIPARRQKGKISIEDIKSRAEEIADEDGRTNYAVYDRECTERILESSCFICKLFGSPWLASRVLFKDLFINEDSWFGRFELRDGVGIDRDTGAARQGIKYDFEVVPALARFNVQIVVENSDCRSFGLLAAGLRELERQRVAIGGKTTRGLGLVRLVIDQIEIVGELEGDSRAALVNYLVSGSTRKLSGAPLQEFMTENIRILLEDERDA
jgi:CRISPR-associated RAMP protein (TIGR02581 family)